MKYRYLTFLRRQEGEEGGSSGNVQSNTESPFQITPEVLPKFVQHIEKQFKGKVFLDEKSYNDSLNSVRGQERSNLFSAVKSMTGVSWETGEDPSTYVARALQAKSVSGTQTAELETLKTKYSETAAKENEWKSKYEALMQEQKKIKDLQIIDKALTSRQFKNLGNEQLNELMLNNLKNELLSKMPIVEENGKVYIKHEKGMSDDINSVIAQYINNSPFKDLFSEAPELPNTLPNSNSNTVNGAARESRKNACETEITSKGLEPHVWSDPKVQAILKSHGFWENGKSTLYSA